MAFDVAGLGSRFVAALIDGLIQFSAIFVLWIAGTAIATAGGWLSSNTGRSNPMSLVSVVYGIAAIATFLVMFAYHIIFELVWNGQTPGKRLSGIRVIGTSGRPITSVQVFIRNLVRLVDYLPWAYMLGAIVMLATRRSQRLGDLAAGTLVVKEHREAAPRTLSPSTVYEELPPQLAAAFTADDVALARDFMLRADDLDAERRRALANRIATRLRARLDAETVPDPDIVLIGRVAAIGR